MNKKATPKLIIIDCDGVLYDAAELDRNALIFAFNDTCKDLGHTYAKVNFIDDCTQDKPVKGIYNYINYVASQIGIDSNSFIAKTVEHVDYSHIQPDKNGVLEYIKKLQKDFKVCICSNNHLMHVNKILRVKFGITADKLPFEVFDMTYAQENGVFYQKESKVFITKLEKHFNIKAKDFIWIDDSQNVLEQVKKFKSETFLITETNRLIDVLNQLECMVI